MLMLKVVNVASYQKSLFLFRVFLIPLFVVYAFFCSFTVSISYYFVCQFQKDIFVFSLFEWRPFICIRKWRSNENTFVMTHYWWDCEAFEKKNFQVDWTHLPWKRLINVFLIHSYTIQQFNIFNIECVHCTILNSFQKLYSFQVQLTVNTARLNYKFKKLFLLIIVLLFRLVNGVSCVIVNVIIININIVALQYRQQKGGNKKKKKYWKNDLNAKL